MPKGQTYKKERRDRRLSSLERFFILKSKATNPSYPTVTQIAKSYSISTPAIYRDLEYLKLKLGPFIVPHLVLGGKECQKKK